MFVKTKKIFFIFGFLVVIGGGGFYLWSSHFSSKTHHHTADHTYNGSINIKTIIHQAKPQTDSLITGMVWIPGASYARGCFGCDLPDALPIHRVHIDGFWLDETPVTNSQFAQFIKETSYRTVAERPLNAKDYPEVPKDQLVSGSAVFTPPATKVSLKNPMQWWRYQAGASWAHPEGPDSNINDRWDHPAVHIAYDDALAYCTWAQKRLPTEAEFEFAARSGLDGKRYGWGDELTPNGKWPANIWQGSFPFLNKALDGYKGTSPVLAFPANPYGLRDMSGNVWQWVSDWYRPDYYQILSAENVEAVNPKGPQDSFDPDEPGVAKRVQKGGSYLCSDEYCSRYLVGSRGRGSPESAGSNISFRCAKSEK